MRPVASLWSSQRRARLAYRAILRREPAKSELSRKELKLLHDDGFFHLLRDMIDSHEFAHEILPSLVATKTQFRPVAPVFFLHIPKTGGTSARLALSEALGAPAFNLYRAWPEPNKRDHSFWPFWAGHAQLSFFPDSHIGITLFRESRSRVLSRYRQNEARRQMGVSHSWRYQGVRKFPKSVVPDFSSWLQGECESGRSSILKYFLPSEEEPVPRIRSSRELSDIMSRPHQVIEKQLDSVIPRFRAASWLHDEAKVLDAIASVSGKRPAELPRENTFVSKDYLFRKIRLSKHDLELLHFVARHDEIVLNKFVAAGLIPELSAEDKDDQFEQALDRLAFSIG